MYFVIENEERKMIDQAVIDRINQGDVKAFECLYNDYFVYLCACANSYIFNAEEAQDIVNEVFMKLWYKRGDLFFPIHSYLVRSVQNGCLNYLRSLHSRERVADEYRETLLEYQEEYCMSECNPLKEMEQADLERQVQTVSAELFLNNIFILNLLRRKLPRRMESLSTPCVCILKMRWTR